MNTTVPTASIVRVGEGLFADLGDHRGFAKVTAQDTNGAFLLIETEADFQGGVPPHVHYREDETFYILSGRIVFQVGDQTLEVGPGDTVYGPRDIPHAWTVVSPEGAQLLIMFTPGENFQNFALAMAARGAVPLDAMANPALIAEFVALTNRYGIEMLPPADIK